MDDVTDGEQIIQEKRRKHGELHRDLAKMKPLITGYMKSRETVAGRS